MAAQQTRELRMHIFPARWFVIETIRDRGARAVYGPAWPLTDRQTLTQVLAISDRDWASRYGCDHCTVNGDCLGHPA
jgi:hypothetical protein